MKPKILDPNTTVEQAGICVRWLNQLVRDNDSDELNDDGSPSGTHYSNETLAGIAQAMAHGQMFHLLVRHIFRLHQGDISEEQFHHDIDEDLTELEESLNED